MVDKSEVRQLCPSISFFFARLGAFLGSSSAFCPLIEGFIFGGSGLGLVLADLLSLLHQSVSWFEELVGNRGAMSEVRSSKLETRLLSSNEPIEAKVDIAASGRREVRAFHALSEECALDVDILFRFRDRFQFPEEVRIRLPHEGKRAWHFSLGEVCFYEATF